MNSDSRSAEGEEPRRFGENRLRAWLHRQLSAKAWTQPGLSPLNRAIGALILLSVVVAVIETEPSLDLQWVAWLGVADWCFAIVFSFEYLARFYSSAEEACYRGLAGRLRYFMTWRSLIDLAALLPFFFTLGSNDLFVLRLVRLMRLLALARLGHFSRAARLVIGALRERRDELAFSAMVAGSVLLFSATALYAVEGDVQPDHFGSIPRALWWAVATLTTVGYGDAYPITPLGKLLGGLTAISAVGVIAMPAGIIAAAMTDAMRRAREQG